MAGTGVSMEEPQRVLDVAGAFLARDPVRNNLILTIVQRRVEHPEAGRYWVVHRDGDVAGVALQSPTHFFATVSPMHHDAVTAVVEAIVEDGVVLPGVHGEAATAAAFAGHWTECTKSGARPVLGQRLSEVVDVVAPSNPPGRVRLASRTDRELLVGWFDAFAAETGAGADQPTSVAVDQRVAAGQLWVWEERAPVALAALSDPVANVVRVGPVFTPAEHRRLGYASALVGELSRRVRNQGRRCILYTDLGNPTSNAIYRALGYRVVAEAIRYDFAARA